MHWTQGLSTPEDRDRKWSFSGRITPQIGAVINQPGREINRIAAGRVRSRTDKRCRMFQTPGNRIVAQRIIPRIVTVDLKFISLKIPCRGGCFIIGLPVFFGVDERVFASPLEIEALAYDIGCRGRLRTEVAVHEDGSRRVGLGRMERFIIHSPDMPRPDAPIPVVKEADDGIAMSRTGRKIDPPMIIYRIADNAPESCAALPNHPGGRTVKRRGGNSRCRFAIALYTGIE